EPAAGIDLEHLAVAVQVGNVGDLVALQPVLDAVMPRALARRMDWAEMAGEVDLLIVSQFLIVKDHDRVPVDGAFASVPVGRIERVGEIDAGEFGNEVGTDRGDGDAHNRLLRL